MTDLAIIISPNWGDYGAKYLGACLASLATQVLSADIGRRKLFILDNESSAASLQFLQNLVHQSGVVAAGYEVEFVCHQHNAGFAEANNAAMKQALAQEFAYLFLLNIDTEMAPDCLAEIIQVAQTQKVGAVQARLMLSPDKNLVNSLGNVTHFLGFGFCSGYRQPWLDRADEFVGLTPAIAYPSGAAVCLSAAALRQVGLLDENFWMYNEDQDLGWRLQLAGWPVILAPTAVVYHKYEFQRSARKYFWLERNRLLVMWKNYHGASLLIILPVALISEIGLWTAACWAGWGRDKARAWGYFFQPQNWSYLHAARRHSQSLRQVSDHELLKLFSARIDYQELNGLGLRAANLFWTIVWKILKFLIVW